MAPFRNIPTDSNHRFEIIEYKLLEEDTAGKPGAVYVTETIVVSSNTFLQNKVIEENILEETKKAAMRE